MKKLRVFFEPSFGKLAKKHEDGLEIILDEPVKMISLLKNMGIREWDYAFLTQNDLVISPEQEVSNGDTITVFSMEEIAES